MATDFRQTRKQTNIQLVYNFLQSQVTTPDRRVEVTGDQIMEATALSRAKVYDAIYVLDRKKLVRKEQSGARHRPMILRVTEPPTVTFKVSSRKEFLALLGDAWPCPHCGKPIDLAKAVQEKRKFLREKLVGLDHLEAGNQK